MLARSRVHSPATCAHRTPPRADGAADAAEAPDAAPDAAAAALELDNASFGAFIHTEAGLEMLGELGVKLVILPPDAGVVAALDPGARATVTHSCGNAVHLCDVDGLISC